MFRYALAGMVMVIALLSPAVQAAAIKFARYPHIAQGKLVFSYHGDLWIARDDGANPSRLTAHVGRDIFPRFSPDGKWVAFSSNRMGNDDIYAVPATGGEPRQLTHATVDDTVLYWTPDGRRILFATARGERAFASPLHTVSLEGGLPEPLEMDAGQAGMFKQDGMALAFNRTLSRYWRKGYRGNATADLWLMDVKTGEFTKLTNLELKEFKSHAQDCYPMWGADGMIYFASERDGTFNIWKIAPSGGKPAQVTFHKSDGVQFPSISPDGKTIAYENEFELWALSVPDGKPRKITIDMDFDPKQNLISYLPSQGKTDGFDPSPDGEHVAVDFHGEIFTVPADPEYGEKTQVTASAWREQNERFSPNGRYIAYLSDESREQEVWIYDANSGARRKVSSHASFKEIGPWSPDNKQLVFTGANRLFAADVESGTVSELAHNPAGGYQVSDVSHDGKWLVYTRRDDDMNSEVYLFDMESKREHNATQNPFNDTRGTLTPDGKKLVFLSDRSEGINQLFVVPLARLLDDPEDPLVKERLRKTKQDLPAAAPPLAVEVDGIGRRARQLTSGDSAVGGYFLSSDGALVYFVSSDQGGRALFSITIEGKDRKKVSEGSFSGLTPTYDRKRVFYVQDGDLYRMELTGDKKKSKIRVDVTVKIDHREEWAQILDECWRVMKYRFYDEDMHGRDWDAIKARYEPLLKYVGENQDVYDLANEMIGELNASHTGVSGPPSFEIAPAYRSRHLGFEMKPDSGSYRITHIYRDGPADKEWLGLKEGDYVVAIDGTPLQAGDNYWELMSHRLNEYVTVKVSPTPSGPPREVRIQTVESLTDIKYEEWVAKNREFVQKESQHQIAYVHIRSMNQPSLRRFQNEVNQFWRMKGIIVDIRYNGGGNIDQELLDILERRPYEYWNNRWGSRTWGRRPRQAIAGPKVMLINYRSGSDSEVTPMGFRDLGLGRIVGNPTSGGVIATGSYRLINGGTIRTPGSLVVTYDPSKPNNYGVNLENYGVPPDVWVENAPEDELRRFDRELKAAIDEALRMMNTGTWQYIPRQ